jgi:zinc transporter
MKRFAYVRGVDGTVDEAEAGAACTSKVTDGRFAWIHLDGHAEDTFAWLSDHGNLPDTVAYALTAIETRPRCEPIGDGALINLRGPAAKDVEGDPLVSIRIWADRGRLISVAYRHLDGLDEVVETMKQGKIQDPGDLIALLAIAITKRIDPIVTDLGDLVDDCETALDAKSAFETRRKIAAARSDAIIYRRFVVPEREALTKLAGLEVGWLEESDRLHLREAADRFARMAEELESARERSALIHEQLTDLRSELIENRALLLSIVALIFLPLTFITGLLGMNVKGIPFAEAPWAFDAVCIFCVVIAIAITAWFALAHWFRG